MSSILKIETTEPGPEHEQYPAHFVNMGSAANPHFIDPEAKAKRTASLLERAYALRYDPANVPPPDETCLTLGDYPIGARGNLTVIQGKSKVGKSAVFSAILGAIQRGDIATAGDTLAMEWTGGNEGSIIHLDTEQSLADWHGLVGRSVTRSGLHEVSPQLVSLPLVMFSRSERLDILKGAMEKEHEANGSIAAVIIDGAADLLCKGVNDEAESNELVSVLHALSQTYSIPIFCALHENPGTTDGKTRGHFGSELNRKAFASLRLDKDAETLVTTMYGLDMRKRDLPKDQGFCFAWDDKEGMHTFQGREAGLRAATRDAKKKAEELEYFAEIFTPNGTNGSCPVFTPAEAVQAHRDNIGTEKAPKEPAMKKRMQRAESLGALRKSGRGAWTLTETGQTGHE